MNFIRLLLLIVFFETPSMAMTFNESVKEYLDQISFPYAGRLNDQVDENDAKGLLKNNYNNL